eukprot:TRINITY_DN6500_c0_g1_i1.p1 TRINITY_DN6500_c0_g1~~TRINITY_DN6500_c0_g1_i1.p1  ORF type:complete len:873 (+),score=331.57 TRINITY_DN6500_c0_g1_i1:76-2694(+)
MILELGTRHHMSTEGLTTAQIDTLTTVSDEIGEHQVEMERLGDAYRKLLDELKEKNRLLKGKDDMIYDLQRDGESDNTRFKERQGRAIAELQALVDSQASDLTCKESELQLAELDKSALDHKVSVLTLKAEEQDESSNREREDLHAEISDLKRLVKARNTQLHERDADVAALESNLKQADDKLQRANQRADNAERHADRAVQDLKLHKATMKAEVLRQAAALENANSKARQAILQAQQERAENVQLVAKVNSLELVNDELAMERSRLDAEVRRLKSELDATRKIEGDLSIELRKLELVNNQKEAANANLKQKLQERQRGLDNERESVDQLADAVQRATDRLKRANNNIDNIFVNQGDNDDDDLSPGHADSENGGHGHRYPEDGEHSHRGTEYDETEFGGDNYSRSTSTPVHTDVYGREIKSASPRTARGRSQSRPKEEPYEPAVLPDEVDRVEAIMDQLSALMEVHGWEKAEEDTKNQQARDKMMKEHRDKVNELEAIIDDLRRKWEEEKSRAEEERLEKARIQKIMQFEKSEEVGRKDLMENEKGEWSVINSGAMAAKYHYIQERMEDAEYLESEARLDVEDLEDAEWNLMMQEADEDFNNVIEILRRRRIREFKAKTAKVRKTAYMGIEVSDGITIRNHKEKVGKLVKDGKPVNTDIEGVKVFNVAQNGPADLAGISSDDVITQFNAVKVRTLSDFKKCARTVKPGDQVQFTVWRDNQAMPVIIQTVEVNEEDFEQGTRRKVGHRITVLKDAKQQRSRHREARRQELRQSQQHLPKIQMSDEESDDEDSPPSYPPSKSGSPLGFMENSAATHTLAGANAGPMTDRMFGKARKNTASGFYNDLESPTDPRSPSAGSSVSRSAPKKSWNVKK